MVIPRSSVGSNAILVIPFLLITSAHAVTIVVDNDAGVDCALREAVDSMNNSSLEEACLNITSANGFGVDDQINFAGSTLSRSNVALGMPLPDGQAIIFNPTSGFNSPPLGAVFNSTLCIPRKLAAGLLIL